MLLFLMVDWKIVLMEKIEFLFRHRELKTYDKKPEMAAPEVTKELINRISRRKYNFIVTNFANTDMVGHTGNFKQLLKQLKQLTIV